MTPEALLETLDSRGLRCRLVVTTTFAMGQQTAQRWSARGTVEAELFVDPTLQNGFAKPQKVADLSIRNNWVVDIAPLAQAPYEVTKHLTAVMVDTERRQTGAPA